ncbi:MAG: hypothetical protein V1740_00995 [Candidatus Woesearchaeota archaeon]
MEMDQKLLNKIKNEGIYVLILLVLTLVLFKLVFFKESVLVILRTVVSLYWLFIIPGIAMMYYWHDKLKFFERMIVGTALNIGLFIIFSYNISIMGLHIKWHIWVWPVLVLLGSWFVIKFIKEKD